MHPDTQIVGVVGDAKQRGVKEGVIATLYRPFAQAPQGSALEFYVRTAQAPATAENTIRAALHGLDPKLVADSMRTMDEQIDQNVSNERMMALLAMSFALVALLTTAVGLYGVLAYATAQRTKEIGIRMALGAQRSAVVRLVLMDMAKVAAIGIVVALPVAVLLARWLRSELFEVQPFDPPTMIGCVVVTVAMVLLAAALPARRAASGRTDEGVAGGVIGDRDGNGERFGERFKDGAGTMIELKKLERSYKTGHMETWVLRRINLTIREGEFVTVMGPSGAGKSSLLNVLAMLDDQWKGEFYFSDEAVHVMNRKQRAELARRRIGMVFQSYHLLDDLTVAENIDLPLSYKDIPKLERQALVADTLDRFNIVGKKDLFPNQLSGGQQQLVGIARAVIHKPALLLADEPTGNLHSDQAKEIMELFRTLNEQGTTVVQVTHSEVNAGYGTRTIELRDGWLYRDTAGLEVAAEVQA